jgi:lysophospholipase L1-like esterase
MNTTLRHAATVLAVAAAASSGICAAQAGQESAWVGTWATAPMEAPDSNHRKPFTLTTLRQIVHISNGGNRVRIRFTNAYGTDPLTIIDVHVGVSLGDSSIKENTDRSVTFDGAASVRIAPGAEIYSDAVPLDVVPLSDLAISFFIPNQVMRAETYHDFANQTNYIADGDVAGAASLDSATETDSWYFIDGVDVPAVEGSRAIVTLGDSITDGALSTKGANRSWPDMLAARLKKEPGLDNVAVLNQGINGNRVLNQGYGPSAISRLDRDVLAQNGARYVIVLEGINDIGLVARHAAPEDNITAQNLEFGMREIVDVAHAHGLKAFGATLTPYGGAGYYSDEGEQIRETVNDWIRSSGVFDGVIDFDKITRDPANPRQFNPAYDSGDHLHPSDAGYKAMDEGVDLKLFAK